MERYEIYRQDRNDTERFYLIDARNCYGTACEVAKLYSMSPNCRFSMIVNVYDTERKCVAASYKEGFTHKW